MRRFAIELEVLSTPKPQFMKRRLLFGSSSVAKTCMRRKLSASFTSMLLTLALGGCRSVSDPALDPYAGPQPIAVLLDSSVWDAPGALPTPTAAVYEDGQVIFTAWEGQGTAFTLKHRTLTLSPTALESLRRQVHDLAALKPLRPSYKALDDGHLVHDVAHDEIYVRDGRRGRGAVVSVYALGWVLHEKDHPGRSNLPPPRLRPVARGGPPPQFMSLYHTLEALARTPASASQTWTPRHVEVLLRDDFKHKFHRFVPWPAEWPALTSPRARQRGAHLWAVLLEGTELPRVRQVLPIESLECGISLQDKRWAAFWRPVLPGEPTWGNALRDPYRYGRRTIASLAKDLWKHGVKGRSDPWW